MCGIAGYVDLNSGRPSEAVLRAMAHALRRRGPDSSGILIDGPCGLAHTRLSIIDLAGSPQPMQVSQSQVSLVYNGELYNYCELREELRGLGDQFDTNGDTEVLLRWVEREWSDALPRFDGMFGFAAWDMRRRALLLGRDPIGVKPLFYATPKPGVLVFGSEIKALLEHPDLEGEMDEEGLRQVLRFRAVYGAKTLYRGVQQLEPGCFLQFDQRGVRIGQFYDLIAKTQEERASVAGSEAENLARGWELFQKAVKKRLVADVPVGAFLSGGLDSSLVTAVMKQLREPGEEVCTFSVGFEDDSHSELPHANLVARTLGTRHTEVHVDVKCYMTRLAELTGCRDAPLSEPADIAMAEMSRVARQTVKVVLSGEGADEVFAGYPKYAMATAPWMLRKAVQCVGPERAAGLAGRLGMDRRRALVAASALAHEDELERALQWFSYLDQAALQTLLPGLLWTADSWSRTASRQADLFGRLGAFSKMGRMQATDCLSWLPGNLLERADRMTMAEGLELRVPFLDKRLVPFGLALPDHVKSRGRTQKWLVRQWAKQYLPEAIVRRKKWGFRVPLAEWFRGPLKPMLFDYLLSSQSLCSKYGRRVEVQALLDSHASNQVDANLRLWTLLSLEVWYQDVYLARRKSPELAVA